MLLLQNTHTRTALCCNNCAIFVCVSQTYSISVLTPHWLSPPCFFSAFYYIFLQCLTADVNTWVVQRIEGGRRNPGVGDEGKKWQGFREGGITQWAGSPAGGGIDGYLNRPAKRLRVWRLNRPEVGCHSVRRWYVAGAGWGREGRWRSGGTGEGGEELSDWLDNAKTHMHIQTHPLS